MDYYAEILQLELPKAGRFCLKVVLAIVVYLIAAKVIKMVCRILKRSMERANLPAEAISFINSLVRAGLFALLIFSIATQFGVEASSVAALLASAGVGISLAMQGGLSNLAGGVIILLLKPFTVGDYIIEDSGKNEGTVQKIELYYTTLVTMDNRRIVIPNATLTNNTITNVTAMDYRKLELKIGVSYDSDLLRAKEILTELIEQESCIEKEREIQVFVDELCSSCVRLGLRVWVKTEAYWDVRWNMNEKIKLTFDREGILIPYPHMDVYVHQSESRRKDD